MATKVQHGMDLSRVDRLAVEMANVLERDPACAAKYADYRVWVPFNVARIGRLGLHHSRPLRILDIGCGPGYFLAAARGCGHDGFGIDAPANILSDVENRVYSELLGASRIAGYVSPFLIERYAPLQSQLRDLDLITAFWICFNRHRQPDEWGPGEWRFFVDDALSHLRPGGVLHLELNEHPERYGALHWYDEATLDFYRSVGTVDENIVRVTKPR
ncbi:MAG TPA: methyltransferase domain-containing protein [Candidatus Angelobacter sp.]|nr:methyltransferase domain-containing protein [Candidatus Angelobacter sp.]